MIAVSATGLTLYDGRNHENSGTELLLQRLYNGIVSRLACQSTTMNDVLWIALFLIVYFALQLWILPKFGIST
jgi:hypothetical protein